MPQSKKQLGRTVASIKEKITELEKKLFVARGIDKSNLEYEILRLKKKLEE